MKPCLVVVFNHRFEANLPKLRALYRNRFERVHYLMPFYQGNEPDVSAVFDSSARFQNFFPQALPDFRRQDATHYVFIADDLLLDPALNDDTLLPTLGVEPDGGYIKELIAVSDDTFDWTYLYMTFTPSRVRTRTSSWCQQGRLTVTAISAACSPRWASSWNPPFRPR